jgi:hypothetical protein
MKKRSNPPIGGTGEFAVYPGHDWQLRYEVRGPWGSIIGFTFTMRGARRLIRKEKARKAEAHRALLEHRATPITEPLYREEL